MDLSKAGCEYEVNMPFTGLRHFYVVVVVVVMMMDLRTS
jgi:hypothetical protein